MCGVQVPLSHLLSTNLLRRLGQKAASRTRAHRFLPALRTTPLTTGYNKVGEEDRLFFENVDDADEGLAATEEAFLDAIAAGNEFAAQEDAKERA